MKTPTRALTAAALAGLFLLSACSHGSAPTNADELCEQVWQALLNDDVAALTALTMDADDIAAYAAVLGDEQGKKASIKAELLSFDPAEFATSQKSFLEDFKATVERDGLDLADGVYQGVVATKPRFEVPDLKAETVLFEVEFEKRNYVIEMDYARSPDVLCVFEYGLRDYDRVSVSFVRPEGDPVHAQANREFGYEIAFDAETANAQGCWIEPTFDGEGVGMVAGTSLESPITQEIPARVMTRGTHTVGCRIHPVGTGTGYPVGEVEITLEVE